MPLLIAAFAVSPAAASAAVVDVDTPLDSADNGGDCSLREAVNLINNAGGLVDDCVAVGSLGSDDTIQLLANTVHPLTIASTNEDANANGDLDVLVDMTITGDTGNPPAIDNQVSDRVIDIAAGASVGLEELTVSDGQLAVTPARGANIRFQGGAGDSLILSDVTVQGGRTPGGPNDRGAGIAAEGGGQVDIQDGSLITDNVATGTGSTFFGGGVYIGGASTDLTVSGSTISENEAGVGDGVTLPTGGVGGGIYSAATGDSLIVLDGATISDNRAGGGSASSSGNGGGVAIAGTSSLGMIGGTIDGNVAAGGFDADQGRGGGIYAESTAGAVSLEGAVVTGNEAGGNGGDGDGFGGGLYADRSVSVSDGSQFTTNEAGVNPTVLGADGVGGAVSVNGIGSDLTVTDSTIHSNTAGEFTGGTGNGGGIEMRGTGELTVTGSTISGNNANGGPGNGGGIYRESTSPTAGDAITNSTLSAGQASSGGGLYVRDDNTAMTIVGSTLSANTANGLGVADGGGAIYSESALDVVNSTIANNSTSGVPTNYGAGIRTNGAGAGLSLEHVTMAGQLATAPADFAHLYVEATTTVRASVIGADGGVAAKCGGDPGLGLVDSQGFNVEVGSDECALDGSGDMVNAAGFGGLGSLGANGGPTQTIPLETGSPAIDRVTSGCPPPATDQRGQPRPFGAACDSGAFELQVTAGPADPPVTPPVTTTKKCKKGFKLKTVKKKGKKPKRKCVKVKRKRKK